MMCLNWPSADTGCSKPLDPCAIVAMEGGSVVIDESQCQAEAPTAWWKWVAVAGVAYMIGSRKGKGR